MFQRFDHRAGHWFLLLLVGAGMFLVNLGGPSLWDIDEGNNAEAAREMLESGNWIVPRHNYQLRVDKPALLYWLQAAAYRSVGVNEFAARLPSALAALFTLLLAYELGRRLFGPSVGRLGGVVLASTTLFAAAAHFANPDALLNLCTVLTLLIFWFGFSSGRRWWFVSAGVGTGLAMLTKGPVGLVLPGMVVLLFLLWSRRLSLLLDRRLFLGVGAFLLITAPWFALVGTETKTEFLRGFFLKHNVSRFLSPMENHRGPIFYYLLVLGLGYLPWSLFYGLAGWDLFRALRRSEAAADEDDPRPALRFLVCWIVVYVGFFSLAATKLPNYILPVAAPVAILTARFLDRWRRGVVSPPAWTFRLSLAGMAFMGVVVIAGLLLATGIVPAPFLRGLHLTGAESWIWLGGVLLAGAIAAGWFLHREQRSGVVLSCTAAAMLFVGGVGAHGGASLNAHKAPQPLAQAVADVQTEREVRVGAYEYFQPSMVFYTRREVERLRNDHEAIEFLRTALPVYLYLPAPVWERLQGQTTVSCRVVGRQRDLYRRHEVVVVTNR